MELPGEGMKGEREKSNVQCFKEKSYKHKKGKKFKMLIGKEDGGEEEGGRRQPVICAIN